MCEHDAKPGEAKSKSMNSAAHWKARCFTFGRKGIIKGTRKCYLLVEGDGRGGSVDDGDCVEILGKKKKNEKTMGENSVCIIRKTACCRDVRGLNKNVGETHWTRLAAWTSISSILYELSSSLMRCARAGVRRLHVAGSLRRSYTFGENVS